MCRTRTAASSGAGVRRASFRVMHSQLICQWYGGLMRVLLCRLGLYLNESVMLKLLPHLSAGPIRRQRRASGWHWRTPQSQTVSCRLLACDLCTTLEHCMFCPCTVFPHTSLLTTLRTFSFVGVSVSNSTGDSAPYVAGCLWTWPGSHQPGVARRFKRKTDDSVWFDGEKPDYDLTKFVPLEVQARPLIALRSHASATLLSACSALLCNGRAL